MTRHYLLDALYEVFHALAIEAGADPGRAAKLAQASVKNLQRDFGGRRHYLPALDRDRRQQDMLADLQAGLSLAAVAAKHEVGLKTVSRAKRSAK